MEKQNYRVVVIAAVTSFVVAVVAATSVFSYLVAHTQSGRSLPAPLGIGGTSDQSLIVQAVKGAQPAVVSITVSKNIPILKRFSIPDPFGDFFGLTVPVPEYRQDGVRKQAIGGGSGFLISADGYIVTNRHVVDDSAAEYTVFTNDGKEHAAKVIAADPVLDIALIKIPGSQFPYLQFGDSDKLEVGQTAIAIGNALGEFRNTVSVGVISGLARSIVAGDEASQATEPLDQVIQTDAAINPGNSGGPLLDLDGKVVGVNVALAAGSENVGFALPVNNLKGAIESARTSGKIVRPYLGIRYVQITPELKTKNHLSIDRGVLVRRGTADDELAVIPGSPADKAGIVENDIILELNGEQLDESHSLATLLRRHAVGDTVTLKVWHQGETKVVKVTLSAAPNE